MTNSSLQREMERDTLVNLILGSKNLYELDFQMFAWWFMATEKSGRIVLHQ